MLVPLSWLNEFVKIDKKNLKDLMWKMTEVGITCENYKKVEGDIILDVEVTPNRPDWMSIVGIAREIAAITGTKLTLPEPKFEIKKIKNPLAIKIKPDYKIVPRITSVIIRNVTVKPSPDWLQKRIVQIGLRPINNLVDITNYVLWTYGSLLHVFDYDKIIGHEMTVELSKGGEPFRSLDGIDYILPKNAIIIKDADQIIDLVPLKGGENTASYTQTKNVLLHSILCDPITTRRTSQALKLRSDSSAIAERGLDPNGTTKAVTHALSLILELAGGEVASEIIDHKLKDFTSQELKLNLLRLEKILGVKISTTEIVNILKRLNLSPKLNKEEVICLIPTYRGDLKIEEDLIEEVARIYGYNKFPKTLPSTKSTTTKVPYFYDRSIELTLKNILISSGYYEAITLSLQPEQLIKNCNLILENHIKIANPVSREFEYMRTSLILNLLTAVKLNSGEDSIELFEYGKVYNLIKKEFTEERRIAAIASGVDFRKVKGSLDFIFDKFNITIDYSYPENNSGNGFWHPRNYMKITANKNYLGTFGEIDPRVLTQLGIETTVFGYEINVEELRRLKQDKKFQELSKYPPQIEDLTIKIKEGNYVARLIKKIKSVSTLVNKIELIDMYNDSYTFRIWYQDLEKNLTDKEVEEVRNKILQILK